MKFFNNTEIAVNFDGEFLRVKNFTLEAFNVYNDTVYDTYTPLYETTISTTEAILVGKYDVTLFSRKVMDIAPHYGSNMSFFIGDEDYHRYDKVSHYCSRNHYNYTIKELYKLQFFLMDKFS